MEVLWQNEKTQIEIVCHHCQSGLGVYPGDLIRHRDGSFSCLCKVCQGKIKVEKRDIPNIFFKKE